MDDIPEALREGALGDRSDRPTSSRWLWLGIGIFAAVGLGAFTAWQTAALSQRSSNGAVTQMDAAAEDAARVIMAEPTSSTAVTAAQVPTILGHRAYEEVPRDRLVKIVADGSIKLERAAAEKFLDMQAQARAEGIYLRPVSGFRSNEDQDYLFFQIKADRTQRTDVRAEVSAPPGYSEHHTGYAIDILDGSRSDIDLEVAFENTPAFRWLEQNAARYSFELSFPKDNAQGISYEPWHWRFVGDRDSLETFYKEDSRPEPAESAPAPQ